MEIDQTTLLIASGISGAALAVTFLASWAWVRTDGFLFSWAIGMCLMTLGVLIFAIFGVTATPVSGALAFTPLMLGFCIVYGAANQFRTGFHPIRRVALLGALSVIAVATPFLAGFAGLGTLMANLLPAILLFATAAEYWRCRAQIFLPIAGLVILYVLTGISFALCALVLAFDSPLTMEASPINWAEDFNAIMCIIGITGAGALSLALKQSRVAQRHQHDALTDALTDLSNRRALFELHDARPLDSHTAIIVFDLDAFKAVNDRYGHHVGDTVLRRFAQAISTTVQPTDTAARLGGEEFAVVLSRSSPELALLLAERIRAHFESDLILTEQGPLHCTVSAGVAFAQEAGEAFEDLLRAADDALYAAKRGGRNRVMLPGPKRVA